MWVHLVLFVLTTLSESQSDNGPFISYLINIVLGTLKVGTPWGLTGPNVENPFFAPHRERILLRSGNLVLGVFLTINSTNV